MPDAAENADFPIILGGRSLIRISGADAADFLNATVTADINSLAAHELRLAALLSPQGKILFDFLIARLPPADAGDFQIDIVADAADAFARRLAIYRLHRQVEISAPQAALAHIANEESAEAWRDMRFPADFPIWRSYSKDSEAQTASAREKWDRLRIAYGIGEGGRDFPLGDAFPHDVNYDVLGGVSFRKGCYIGQEIVSRMQHKAAIRKRLMRAAWTQPAAAQMEGAEITAGGKAIGRLGSVCGCQALALVRTDKIPQAGDNEQAQAGGTPLHFTAPPCLPGI